MATVWVEAPFVRPLLVSSDSSHCTACMERVFRHLSAFGKHFCGISASKRWFASAWSTASCLRRKVRRGCAASSRSSRQTRGREHY